MLSVNSQSVLMLVFSPAFASKHRAIAQHQDIALIKNAIENFLYNNTATLSGQVIVNVGQIDRHLALPHVRTWNLLSQLAGVYGEKLLSGCAVIPRLQHGPSMYRLK